MDQASRSLVSLAAARANALQTDWDHAPIPVPWFIGRRFMEPTLDDLLPFMRWTSLEVPAAVGRERLQRLMRTGTIKPRGVYGFWPANSQDDDIVVYKDDARATSLVRLHMLRQQEHEEGSGPSRSLADFVAPRDSFAPDYIGAFVVTINASSDMEGDGGPVESDEGAGDREALIPALVEALAEVVHKQARADWNLGGGDGPTVADLLAGQFRGIRAQLGGPSCPNVCEGAALLRLLHASEIGLTLTEDHALVPAPSMAGLYFAHPEATIFRLGGVGRDQVADYAERKGITADQAERWLAASLGY